jgi:hypothetical protein
MQQSFIHPARRGEQERSTTMIKKLIPAALSVFALSAMAAGDAASVGVGVGIGMGAKVREKQASSTTTARVNARASVDAQVETEREELRRERLQLREKTTAKGTLQARQPSALGGAVGAAVTR